LSAGEADLLVRTGFAVPITYVWIWELEEPGVPSGFSTIRTNAANKETVSDNLAPGALAWERVGVANAVTLAIGLALVFGLDVAAQRRRERQLQ
jgi:hypothetical protein